MLTYLSNLLLGTASRAGALVLDAEARIVMPEHWRLVWQGSHGCGRVIAGGLASSLG